MKTLSLSLLSTIALVSSEDRPVPTPTQPLAQSKRSYEQGASWNRDHVQGLLEQDVDQISLEDALQESEALFIQPSGWRRILGALKSLVQKR